MKISILALEGLSDTALFLSLDTFALANRLFVGKSSRKRPFDVRVIGVRKKVRSGHARLVPLDDVPASWRPDWVLMPAAAAITPEDANALLKREDVNDACSQLLKWYGRGASIAASGTSCLLVAQAGLLDHHHKATTAWWLSPYFRKCFPNVLLEESRILVESDRIVTAGAMMGHLDLCLWLVRKANPDLAVVVSHYMLADVRSSQAGYILPDRLEHHDALVEQFDRWARVHLRDGFALNDAARVLDVSARTLQRRCEAVLGKSPLSYFQDLRVERASSLLQGGALSLEAIASEVGYSDVATLRSLLRERLGRGVRELR